MPEVEYINFNEQEDEVVLLTEKIKDLLKKGIKPSDITLLSVFKFEKSVASKITKYKIDKVGEDSENITYSTIQGFKGLENKVIIVTDVITYNKPKKLFYSSWSVYSSSR